MVSFRFTPLFPSPATKQELSPAKNVLELIVNSKAVLKYSRTVLESTVSSRTFFAGDMNWLIQKLACRMPHLSGSLLSTMLSYRKRWL